MNIIEQLTHIYHTEENWHIKKLSIEESNKYHEKLLMQNNIGVFTKDGEVLGYFECWRINFEQFGRLVCGVPVYTFEENITDGNIALVNNVWIHPDHRNGEVYKYLRNKFYELNHNCDFYVGFALRKNHQPIKVFTKDKLNSRLFREGII